MWRLLSQETPGPDPVEWVQYGAIGMVLVSIVLGWLWPRPAVDRVLRETDAVRHRMNVMEHEILPGVKANHEELRQLREEFREFREEFRRWSRDDRPSS